MQPTTDDASHDEALSSRVTALNLLDLGLGHLGIEVGEAINEEELDLVVKACGDSEYLSPSNCLFSHCPTFYFVSVSSVNWFGFLSKSSRQGGNPCSSSQNCSGQVLSSQHFFRILIIFFLSFDTRRWVI